MMEFTKYIVAYNYDFNLINQTMLLFCTFVYWIGTVMFPTVAQAMLIVICNNFEYVILAVGTYIKFL